MPLIHDEATYRQYLASGGRHVCEPGAEVWLDPAHRIYGQGGDLHLIANGAEFKGSKSMFRHSCYVEDAVFRTGIAGHEGSQTNDSIEVWQPGYGTFQHFKRCSFAHGTDSVADTWGVERVLFEDCTFAEGLTDGHGEYPGSHSTGPGLCGILPGGQVDFVNCLFSGSQSRGPKVDVAWPEGYPTEPWSSYPYARINFHNCVWVNNAYVYLEQHDYRGGSLEENPYFERPFLVQASMTSCWMVPGQDVAHTILGKVNPAHCLLWSAGNEIQGAPAGEAPWAYREPGQGPHLHQPGPFPWSGDPDRADTLEYVRDHVGAWITPEQRHPHAERVANHVFDHQSRWIADPLEVGEPTVRETA